jgi:hypothetical protein
MKRMSGYRVAEALNYLPKPRMERHRQIFIGKFAFGICKFAHHQYDWSH